MSPSSAAGSTARAPPSTSPRRAIRCCWSTRAISDRDRAAGRAAFCTAACAIWRRGARCWTSSAIRAASSLRCGWPGRQWRRGRNSCAPPPSRRRRCAFASRSSRAARIAAGRSTWRFDCSSAWDRATCRSTTSACRQRPRCACRSCAGCAIPRTLDSVAMFREYQLDWPERICVDAVLDAERLGAVVRNYTRARIVSRTTDGWSLELRGADSARPGPGSLSRCACRRRSFSTWPESGSTA